MALATRDGIESARLRVAERPRSGSALESLRVLLKLDRGKQVILGNLYRPPSRAVASLDADFADLETQLQHVIIEHPNTDVVLCGDLNCDFRKPLTDPELADVLISSYRIMLCISVFCLQRLHPGPF